MSDSDHDILDSLVKGAGWTAIGIVVSKFLSYLYRAAIARFVGPEAYGTLSLGIMIVSFATTISVLALNSAIKNFVPKYRAENDEGAIKGIVTSAFEISLPVSLLASASIFLLAEKISLGIFNAPNLIPVLKVFALVPPFAVISQHSFALTLAYRKAKYEVLTRRVLQNVIQLLVSVTLIIGSLGVVGAAIGWLAGSAFSAVIGLYIMEKKFGPVLTSKIKGRREYSKIFHYSYPLVLSGAIATVLGWTDTAFIGYYMDESAVGLYNAALPTAFLMMMPYTAFSTLAMPSMSEVLERDDKSLSKILKTLTRWTFTVSFPMFVLMALFSEQVLHILFGAPYREAALSLTVLSFGYLYSTAVGHLDNVIKALDHTDILFKNALINFVVNVGLNIYLIPLYGIVGGAIATTVSIIVAETMLLVEVYHFKKVYPFSKDSVKPVLAAVPALLIVYAGLNLAFETVPLWALIPGATVFTLIYGVGVLKTGLLKDEELERIKKEGKKIRERLKR
ncbi:flippase [Candidatus Nanohalococcus occultus]|uniref:Polysaccharide biosynthesis protein n=1 Tax=Candidatus Nanohalococcus occultus TaxID=2978047 RepID=A0ABY8CHS1_9ARCH|nr:Polysaccharide biosynthesis protein [Candidatus Nanohaloarchaeota archaeon SVXNc]